MQRQNFLLLLCCIQTVVGGSYLYDHLHNTISSLSFSNTVPVMELNQPMSVYVNFTLQRVVNLDRERQEVEAEVLLSIRWNDFRTAWDPWMFGGVQTLVWHDVDAVWKPDIVVDNGPSSTFDASPERSALVFSLQGNVTWYRQLRLRVPCDVTCSASLRSWSYNSHTLRLFASGMTVTRANDRSGSRFEAVVTDVTTSRATLDNGRGEFDVLNYHFTVNEQLS